MHPNAPSTGARRLPVLAGLALLFVFGLGASPAVAGDGYLGVYMQGIDEALAAALDLEDADAGVLLSDVLEDSPAEAAGLQRGDVVLAIDGDAISSPDELRKRIGAHEEGDVLSLTLLRRGERRTVEVTLGKNPEPTRRWKKDLQRQWHDRDDNVFLFGDDEEGDREIVIRRFGGPMLGVRLEKLDEEGLGHYFGADAGLLVLEVYEDTAADQAGVQPGDVLVELGGEPLDDVAGLRKALSAYGEDDEVELVLLRDRERRTLTVEIQDDADFDLGHAFDLQRLGRGHRMFHFDAPHAPRHLRLERDRDELKQLRQELEELRQEVERMREGG